MKGKENRADTLQREEMAFGICKIMTKRKLERTLKFIAEHTATLSIGNSETTDSMVIPRHLYSFMATPVIHGVSWHFPCLPNENFFLILCRKHFGGQASEEFLRGFLRRSGRVPIHFTERFPAVNLLAI